MAKPKDENAVGTIYRTVDELMLAELPAGSVVISGLGTAWQRSEHGKWVAASDTPLELHPSYDEDLQLVYRPVGDWS